MVLTKEETLDLLINKCFWYNKDGDRGDKPGFEWLFEEGTTTGWVSPKLNEALEFYYKDRIN